MAEILASPGRAARLLRIGQLWLPMALVVAVLFGVSGGLLWDVGLNYEGLSGGAASKIHPSTYMLVLLFAWAAFASGDIIGYLVHVGRRRPASVFLLAAAALMFAHIAARAAPGLAGTIDTNLGPPLMVLLLADFDERSKQRIEITIHVLMTANALMGLGEFFSGYLVFPYRFDGAVFPTDTRSTALQGHPLVNAAVGCAYLLSLMAGGGPSLPKLMRLPMMALQFASLVTFGGRTAIVVSLTLGSIYALTRLHRMLRRGRVPLLGAAAGIFLLTFLPLAIGGMAASGFFDALLLRFQSDGGSANARVQMFDLFAQLPLRDLMIGPDASLVDSLRRVIGLEWGIENPIMRSALYNGIIMTGLWAVAIVLFIVELVRFSRPGVMLPVIGFSILLNTSESIGGKTTMLTKFAVMMLCLFPLALRRTAEARAPGNDGTRDLRPADRARP